MKVEICIAIFNEENTLLERIEQLMHFLEKEFSYDKKVDFSIVIADNGSTDSSQKIAETLTLKYSNLSYIREGSIGAGRVIKSAWASSNADILAYMDLDLATNLRHIAEAIRAIEEGVDIVSATRLNAKSQVLDRTFLREFLSKSFNGLSRLFLHTNFEDAQCGFKFLKKEIAQKLISTKLMSNGLFFASHILIYGQLLGAKILQLPVSWQDSPSSKIRLFSFSLECVVEIFKTRKNKVYKGKINE